MKDILKKTSKPVDQVTIQPNGSWVLNEKKENHTKSKQNGVASDSDDSDLIEITKTGSSIRLTNHRTSQTPISAEASRSSSGPPRSTAGKRPIAAVIDLTSSGDEDDEPLRPAAKRQFQSNGYGTPSTVPAFRPAHPLEFSPRP